MAPRAALAGLERCWVGVSQGICCAPASQGCPGRPTGVKIQSNFQFPGVPQRATIPPCRTPKRSYMVSNASLRSPRFCTRGLRWVAWGPPLNAPFGASKWLPGPLWPGWSGAGSACPRGAAVPLQWHTAPLIGRPLTLNPRPPSPFRLCHSLTLRAQRARTVAHFLVYIYI